VPIRWLSTNWPAASITASSTSFKLAVSWRHTMIAIDDEFLNVLDVCCYRQHQCKSASI
jgi:hypothetical protein